MDADDWVMLAHSDAPIACHQTIVTDNDEGEGNWADPRMRQCAGAANYRRNIGKLPRDPDVAVGERDENVFGSPREFLSYHGGSNG